MKYYIFTREDGFYTLQLKNDEDVIANARCNHGTIKVEDLDGALIWTLSDEQDK